MSKKIIKNKHDHQLKTLFLFIDPESIIFEYFGSSVMTPPLLSCHQKLPLRIQSRNINDEIVYITPRDTGSTRRKQEGVWICRGSFVA